MTSTFNVLKSRVSPQHLARAIFNGNSAEFLTSVGSTSPFPALNGLPEVIVTGRANVGKSSLLNSVVGRTKLFNVSKKPGRTQMLNFFRLGGDPGKCMLVDAPGYGARGRPEWGELFQDYVCHRQELRRIYVLFNAKHGVKDFDREMLKSLYRLTLSASGPKFTMQPIFTKVDMLKPSEAKNLVEMPKDILDVAPTCLTPIVTSVMFREDAGINLVRESILEACGLIQ